MRLIRFIKKLFHRHTFELHALYCDGCMIIHKPVWGKRLESVSLRCKCGKEYIYPMSGVFKVDFDGIKAASQNGAYIEQCVDVVKKRRPELLREIA